MWSIYYHTTTLNKQWSRQTPGSDSVGDSLICHVPAKITGVANIDSLILCVFLIIYLYLDTVLEPRHEKTRFVYMRKR